MKTCFIYGLTKSGKGSSKKLENQYKTCKKYAGEAEIRIDGFYFDNLGNSDDKRPAMEHMMEDAVKKDVDYIIVFDLSCIDPDIDQVGKFLEELVILGVGVISVKGIGGNLFDAENCYLPDGIIQYLHGIKEKWR